MPRLTCSVNSGCPRTRLNTTSGSPTKRAGYHTKLLREMVEEHVKRADAIVAAALSSGHPA